MLRSVIERDPNVDPEDAEAEAQEIEEICAELLRCSHAKDRTAHLLWRLLTDFGAVDARVAEEA